MDNYVVYHYYFTAVIQRIKKQAGLLLPVIFIKTFYIYHRIA